MNGLRANYQFDSFIAFLVLASCLIAGLVLGAQSWYIRDWVALGRSVLIIMAGFAGLIGMNQVWNLAAMSPDHVLFTRRRLVREERKYAPHE